MGTMKHFEDFSQTDNKTCFSYLFGRQPVRSRNALTAITRHHICRKRGCERAMELMTFGSGDVTLPPSAMVTSHPTPFTKSMQNYLVTSRPELVKTEKKSTQESGWDIVSAEWALHSRILNYPHCLY